MDREEALIRRALDDDNGGNILYGKKWVVCGDSFTNGVTGHVIPAGFCAGMPMTYPYFIASRNHMEIVPFFRGGRTLAFPTDGSFHNSLTDPGEDCYYQKIPADADYITICLGINDSHHEHGKGGDGEDPRGVIPLGEPDDRDTHSYWGAWNVVLSWLRTNRPFCHLGILISNGCDRPAYREVQRAAARRYGVPFLDLNGDDDCPAMIRSQNPEVDPLVKQQLLLHQAVNYPVNTHPNDAAHAFASAFIEAFLRRI